MDRAPACGGVDALGEGPEQEEPLAGPGKGVAQVEGEDLGKPGAQRRLALDADPENGLVRRGPLEPGDGLAHGQDVDAARQGVDAGGAVDLHGGKLAACGRSLHAGHGGLGREGDDGLGGAGLERVGRRQLQQAVDDLGEVLVKPLVDEAAEEGHALEDALHVRIGAPGAEQGRGSRMRLGKAGAKLPQVGQLFGVVVLHVRPFSARILARILSRAG